MQRNRNVPSKKYTNPSLLCMFGKYTNLNDGRAESGNESRCVNHFYAIRKQSECPGY